MRGEAYGYLANVSFSNGPPSTRGPEPVVTLPPTGSATPITASLQSGLVQLGPAILFSSSPITVSTQGTTGAGGSVTSSAEIQEINRSASEIFTADRSQSTCIASEAGLSGSTTITNGLLDLGPDANPRFVNIPPNPARNTTYEGTVEGESFQATFNRVFAEVLSLP